MRILIFTAGAANMFCGSCLRDNTLARELMRRGHDVTLLPLYTPVRTDELSVSQGRVFFGGISVYLEQYVPVMRSLPSWMDWLWDRPSIIKAFAGRSVNVDPKLLGELTVSMLNGEHGHQRKEFAKLVEWLRTQPKHDVMVLPNSLLISLAGPLKRALGARICCTLQGEDLFLEGLLEPYRTQALQLIRRQAPDVDLFVAVSNYYADFMVRYLGLRASAVRVARIGIDPEGYDAAPEGSPGAETTPRPFTVGYFARIAPEKGLHVLVEAYEIARRELGLPKSRLRVAGYSGAEHREYVAAIRARVAAAGLAEEFDYVGEVDRQQKIAFLQGLDVMSVPTPYAEPKGLFLVEAMACGTPVVQPRHGAFPEMLALTQGGVLVEPDSPRALAEGLMQMYRDPTLRRQLGAQGAEGVRKHYHASVMADHAEAAFAELVGPARVFDVRAARA